MHGRVLVVHVEICYEKRDILQIDGANLILYPNCQYLVIRKSDMLQKLGTGVVLYRRSLHVREIHSMWKKTDLRINARCGAVCYIRPERQDQVINRR